MSAMDNTQLDPRQTDTRGQLLKLFSDPFQASLQENAFWASLGTSIGISVALALIFSLVRPRHRLIYAPRAKHADEKHAPPPVGNGIFSWVMPVLKTKENVLLDKIGLDAIVFLRFARMLRNIYLILAVVGIGIMIPVNVTQGSKDPAWDISAFQIMTPMFVWGNGLWAQVVVAYTSNLVIVYFLWHNYRRIFQLRRTYLESPEYQASLHARTLLITDVSPDLRNDNGLLRITDEVNPTGVTPKVTMGRNVKILPDLIEEHEEHVRKLESVLAKYIKNPERLPANRPTMKAPKPYKGADAGGQVDAIDFLTERVRQLEYQIGEIREQVDKRDANSYGFASWDQIAQAHTVAFAARSKKPQGAKIALAPRPNDLIWNNLGLSKTKRRSKRIQNGVWVTILTLIWLPINACIAIFLSNLSNLGAFWPAFQIQLQKNSSFWALVQGIASPAITSLVYLILPIIFRRLQIRAGDATKTEREQHVLRNLFTFFTFNNLIVFSIFSAIWQFTTTVIKNNRGGTSTWDSIVKADLFLTITLSLCRISPFWVTWLLQRNLGAAIDLAQLWRITIVWFERTFMAPTPRQNIEWTAPLSFEYASYYNYFLFYATVALCYSTLQPLVLLVTAMYFTFDSVLKKYLLMYVFVTKNESGGAFWVTLFNRLIFSAMLSDVIIAIVVFSRGSWSMVIALVVLLPTLGAFKWYCKRNFDDKMKYYNKPGVLDQEQVAANNNRRKPRAEKIATKFGHPALYKPLMTPMVHAKARHVLGQIYRGRLNSEGATDLAAGYSDIAMQPMNQSGHVAFQPETTQNAPFEIVPEAQQDFTYYKNRHDFREEGGEIYGRPEDLISERSGTPKSFLSMGQSGSSNAEYPYSSPDTSRPATPAPNTPQIKRKEVGSSSPYTPTHSRNQSQHQSYEPINYEPDPSSTDLGLNMGPRHGMYTDPYDDRTTLLRDVGAGDPNLRTPNGEFMSLDRWRTDGGESTGTTPGPGFGYGNGRNERGGGSYDYFREQR